MCVCQCECRNVNAIVSNMYVSVILCVCVFVSVRVSSCLQAFYKEVKTLLSFFYVLQCAKFFVVVAFVVAFGWPRQKI